MTESDNSTSYPSYPSSQQSQEVITAHPHDSPFPFIRNVILPDGNVAGPFSCMTLNLPNGFGGKSRVFVGYQTAENQTACAFALRARRVRDALKNSKNGPDSDATEANSTFASIKEANNLSKDQVLSAAEQPLVEYTKADDGVTLQKDELCDCGNYHFHR